MIINPSLHTIETIEGEIGLDVETTGLKPWEDAIHSIAIATHNRLFVIDVSAYDHDKLAKSLQYMVSHCKVVAHNAKFDVGFLYGFFGVLPRDVFCTQLAAQIIANGKVGIRFNLLATLSHYLKIDVMEDNHKKLMRELYMNHKVGDRLSMSMLEYVASDTTYLLRLMHKQRKVLKQEDLEQVATLENLVVPVLAKMEVDGCRIDVDGWGKLIKSWEERQDKLVQELDTELEKLSEDYIVLRQPFYTGGRNTGTATQFGLFGDHEEKSLDTLMIQYSSNAQIVNMLEDMDEDVPLKKVKDKEFNAMSDKMKQSLINRGKHKYKKSVDEDALTDYINEHPDSPVKTFFTKLLDYRKTTKLISTYGQAFLDQLDSKGRIHTQYTQCRAVTGRLTSVGPNLQNIPPVVRGYFVPEKGNVFITSDMNSAEVRLAADYSKEKLLIDSQVHGVDLHSMLASTTYSILFGRQVDIDNTDDEITIDGKSFVKSKLRKDHKPVLFGKFYKAGPARIYSILSYYINLFHKGTKRMQIARQISESIDNTLPTLTAYLSKIIDEANAKGELRGTKLIRRRRFFNGEVYGEAANYPIQNSNAEAMKIALVNLFEYLEESGDGRLVLNVHDEVVVEPTSPDIADKVGTKVATIVGDSLGMFLEDIEGGASVNIGDHWEK